MSGDGFLDRLHRPGPLVTVELRPPSTNLEHDATLDAWIDLHHDLQRLSRSGRRVFLTDNAVAAAEEENLSHLAGNLPEGVRAADVIPFLTCKHTLDYCLLYASRAASAGFEALTVLGGDRFGGPPRCVPHAFQLRQRIRDRVPELTLGGWVNPHRDAREQVGFLASADFTAEFVLAQVVSHHSLERVEALLEGMEREGVRLPIVFGVFLYRSANPRTLNRLAEYFPVPVAEVSREFSEGLSAEQILARSIRELRGVGADKIYVSNLGNRGADRRLARVLDAL